MYPHILQKVFCEPWAITTEMHATIQELLNERILGSQTAPLAATIHSAQVAFSPMAAGAGLNPPTERGSRLWTRGALGVIPVRGIIGSHLSSLEMMCGGYGVEQLQTDLERAAEQDNIKRVMVDFHSPGGVITGVPETAKQLAELGKKKETFAFTSGQSASASYWLMSQANHVYATESARVGSIGVFVALLDQTKAMEARGEALRLFKAGKYKGMGLPGNALTEEEGALIQAAVDESYAKFTSAITSKRPKVEKATMQGQMFSSANARAAGLIDSVVRGFNSLVARLS